MELFGIEEDDASHANTSQDALDKTLHDPCKPIDPGLSHCNDDIEEQDIDGW